ncbi:hypothetical protein AQUCO_04300059v1 [Aquilegia coerulea]|uniref:F-box domain-containing protein n=1 Tax=Aquilegia coerulea TaxID=218851 RepID=A0A2G5CNH2_AQUCA|nr:hypothetical protein AQUCO_04300059v1 [Aquilegia coerulea]
MAEEASSSSSCFSQLPILFFQNIHLLKNPEMSEWSQLPKDLLDRISSTLSSSSSSSWIDLIRFRSVCSSWRSSLTSYPPYCFPNKISINPSNPTNGLLYSGNFTLSKRIILHLNLPNHSNGWIIKLEQDNSKLFHLLNPLSELKIQSLPSNFPKVFNFMDLRIVELGQEYVLRYADKWPIGFGGDLYREKVVFSSNSPWSNDDYVIMTIHVSGKLALFRLKDSMWTIIEEMPNPYDDVIYYKGKFYAVDGMGRAVVVGPSLTVTLVAYAVYGGDKKYLVELDGELLLVDRYLSIGSDDYPIYHSQIQDYEIYVPNDDTYIVDTTVQFKVFKLDQLKKEWVEVKDLGDRMLFLGDNCSFSALASDFIGSKGNCIYFTDRYFQSNREEDGLFKGHCIGVFNLEDRSIKPLASYPGYSKFFWPPPTWVTSPTA